LTKIGNHLITLHAKHAEIEKRIRDEDSRPAPDADVLHRLKAEKLHIKVEIDRLQREADQSE
jgi:hypothetical protein